eukprot:3777616-Prymnesium_polylepis.1
MRGARGRLSQGRGNRECGAAPTSASPTELSRLYADRGLSSARPPAQPLARSRRARRAPLVRACGRRRKCL